MSGRSGWATREGKGLLSGMSNNRDIYKRDPLAPWHTFRTTNFHPLLVIIKHFYHSKEPVQDKNRPFLNISGASCFSQWVSQGKVGRYGCLGNIKLNANWIKWRWIGGQQRQDKTRKVKYIERGPSEAIGKSANDTMKGEKIIKRIRPAPRSTS